MVIDVNLFDVPDPRAASTATAERILNQTVIPTELKQADRRALDATRVSEIEKMSQRSSVLPRRATAQKRSLLTYGKDWILAIVNHS
jgi:hypothetical protein